MSERWGWLAQFESAEALVDAVAEVVKTFDDREAETLDEFRYGAKEDRNSWRVPFRGESLRGGSCPAIEAFTPCPIDGLAEAMRYRRSPLPWIILLGGVLGGASIFALEYWINLYAYPLNVGGRPLFSWPSFVPPAFEGAILGASLFAIVGLMWVCGLPRLHHPVFEVEAFKRASVDGFFLAVQVGDDDVGSQLKQIGAVNVWEVPDV